jgi:hypothetical protein
MRQFIRNILNLALLCSSFQYLSQSFEDITLLAQQIVQ